MSNSTLSEFCSDAHHKFLIPKFPNCEISADGIASRVCVSWFPHPLWHQDQAPTVSGRSEKGFVQEKTTQQDNQVGEEEETEIEDCKIGKGTECDDGSPNI